MSTVIFSGRHGRRHRRRFLARIVMLACLAAGVALPVLAQVQRSGGGEQQKLMQQYQQISAEKSALQTQLQQANAQLAAAQGELAALKRDHDALKTRPSAAPLVQRLTADKQAAERSLELNKARTSELVSKFRETVAGLKESEGERARLRRELDARNALLDHCVQDNVQLYTLTSEVLDRYANVGFFTKAAAAEPFTKITRVRIENLVGEYRERAEELRAKTPRPAPAP